MTGKAHATEQWLGTAYDTGSTTAELQRCRYPDLSDHEGAVWYAPEASDRVRAEPSSAGRVRLECTRLQYFALSPTKAESEHPIPWRRGVSEPAHRWNRCQRTSGTPTHTAARSGGSGAR
jgi:hypothetical protein